METYFRSLENPSGGHQQDNVPGSVTAQHEAPSIAQGSNNLEVNAGTGAEQQVIVSDTLQQQAHGSDSLEVNNLPPPAEGNVNLEAIPSTGAGNGLHHNGSSGDNSISEQGTSLEQPKERISLEHINSSRETEVTRSEVIQPPKIACAYDAWINVLMDFEETRFPSAVREMSIADALYKLEASKDILTIKLVAFNGSPLQYVEFIDQFKIHIHDKPHLTDDTRMVQLRMHVTGDAEHMISGLGSQGIMYATALKTLKEHFGQTSVIARAFIRKITERKKIQPNERKSLCEFSLDIINCLATLRQNNYFADVNANDNLRKIVKCLLDHLIKKWKNVATDIRDKGEILRLEHISSFVRKRVKAEFDSDFGDVHKSDPPRNSGFQKEDKRNGIHSNTKTPRKPKCYICQAEHRVQEYPTMADSSPEEGIQLAMNHHLCFSCLVRGHPTRDCKSKNKCGKNGCIRIHHPLLHTDPPTNNRVASVLHKGSILAVVRVQFQAVNGKV